MKTYIRALFLAALALAPLAAFTQPASPDHHEFRELIAWFHAQDQHTAEQRNQPVTSSAPLTRTSPGNPQRTFYEYLSARARSISAAVSR